MDQPSTVKQDILRCYNAWMPSGMPPLDSKVLRYWQNMISRQEKTMEDFKDSLLKTDTFVHRIQNDFKDVFYERVGMSEYDASIFDVYRASWSTNMTFDKSAINEWICSTGFFKNKLSQLITGLLPSTASDRLAGDLFVTLLDRFKTQPTYNVESMQRDLPSMIRASVASGVDDEAVPVENQVSSIPTDSVLVPKEWIERIGYALSVDTRDTEAFCARVSEHVDSFGKSSGCTSSVLDMNMLDRFETFMKRPMYVHEYVIYQTVEDDERLPSLFDHQKNTYYEVRDIYVKHINEQLDEYGFVKKYLTQLLKDKEAFMVRFMEDMLQSPEYRDNMKSIIEAKYQRMYSESLDKDDLQFVFEKVKLKRLHLFSDELSSTIVEFKRDTDDIITHVFDKYMSVLDRQPDSYESNRCIKKYREQQSLGLDALDAALEKDLIQSLEYHDIIKQKIRRMYQSKHGREIMPSKTFEILSVCIQRLPAVSSAREMDAFVQSSI